MSMHTGENEQGLRQVMDLMRLISIVVLLLHCYFYCYAAFKEWQLTAALSDRLLNNVARSGLFRHWYVSKCISLVFLSLSILGVRGRKTENMSRRTAISYVCLGMVLYFISQLLFYIPTSGEVIAIFFIVLTALGYIVFLTGGAMLTRIIKAKLSDEVFNTLNETFPQEERLITNEFSFNLPAKYQLKSQVRDSWINYVNPRRGVLILGNPGSGKSFYVLENLLRQQLAKGYAQFTYDMKYPELTTLVYNHFLLNRHKYPASTKFYAISFTNPMDRCNPIFPKFMREIIDAIEASRTILLSINKTWAQKQGEFFVESPMNLLAAVIWFLRRYRDGIYCTLPHAIEFLQLQYDDLFTILRTEPEIETLLTPFLSAYLNDVMETLESQLSSVRIPLGRLSSPLLYWVMSGNDFTLDVNNPDEPKIVCLGNDPTKAEALAPILSLYCDRMNKIINVPKQRKVATNYDEFASIRVDSVQTVISTGRSNSVVCVIAFQDLAQLRKIYSREEADAIWNMTGNIISGQVSGDSARLLSERFPKTMQDRQSLSINSGDTSVSKSKQLEQAITASKISGLSSGEFVGLVADDPMQVIQNKAFHCRIANDIPTLTKEKENYKPLPQKDISEATLLANYHQIKRDIQMINEAVMDDLHNDPAKAHLLVRKD